jgi:hypothetical protein
MRAYLGKQINVVGRDVTPTHGLVLILVQTVEGVRYKIVMDNHFTSLKLFNKCTWYSLSQQEGNVS